MLLLFSTLLDPGDHVLLTDPHYAVYPNLIRYPGGRADLRGDLSRPRASSAGPTSSPRS